MQNDKELTVFDNNRRFVFTNWTNEDFIGRWEGNNETIKVGEIKEYPMYLAYHYAKHLTDREMYKDKKDVMVTVPEERRKYVEKTIAEITGDMESPALTALKDKLRAEIEKEKSVNETTVGESMETPVKGKAKGKKEEKEEEVEFADLK